MPKYKKSTEQLKAKKFAKDCIKNNLNQSEVARQKGVSHQAINQRIHRKPVQNCLKEYFNSIELKENLKKVTKEGLNANRVISAIKGTEATGQTCDFIDVPDHKTRHKFWHDLLVIKGFLRNDNKVNIDQSKTVIQYITYGAKNNTDTRSRI